MTSGKLVREDEVGIWLVASLAAQRSGLTKPELARRALRGELRFQEDSVGRPHWYLEPEIAALAKTKFDVERTKAQKPKRQPSKRNLEARYRREAEELRSTSRHCQNGPLLAHGNRVTIAEIFATKPVKSSDDDS